MAFLDSVKLPSGASPTSGGNPLASSKSKFLSGLTIKSPDASPAPAPAPVDDSNTLPGFTRNAVSAAIDPFVEGFKQAQAQEQPKSLNPIKIAQNGAKAVEDAFAGSLNDAGSKIAAATSIIKDHPLVGAGEITLAALGPIFTAATAPLTYATAVPGLGQVADKVNEVFAALGSGAGAHVAAAIVDDNPFLSQETKDTIRPLVHDSAALVAQLVAGRLGGEGVAALGDKTRAILGAVGKDVQASAPVPRPPTRAVAGDAFVEQTIDHHVQSSEMILGNLDKGEIEKLGGMPALLDRTKTNIADGLVAEGLKDEGEAVRAVPITPAETLDTFKAKATAAAEGKPAPAESAPAGFVPIVAEDAPNQPNGAFLKGVQAPKEPVAAATSDNRAPSRLSQNIATNAVERKLTDSFGDLPEYDKLDFADQAARATDLVASDPARAQRIALGHEPAPGDLLPGAVLAAVEDKAVRAGDVNTVLRLAEESSLSVEASKAGQTIAILGQRDQFSPVKILEDVKKTRVEDFEKKTGTSIAKAKAGAVKEAKDAMKSAAKSSRPSWEEFVSSLTCNI